MLASRRLAFLNEWLMRSHVARHSRPIRRRSTRCSWDGERLFQAAKFGTEMQYQHLVFEEFARKVQPNVDDRSWRLTASRPSIPAIVAEFAHTVYRFGHSMLTETVDRSIPTSTPTTSA